MLRILTFVLCSFVSLFAFDLSVKANVSQSQVFVGDVFEYEIAVTAPENAVVELPTFVGNLGSFEVKEMNSQKITEKMPKGTASFVWQATLNTFVSGDFLIAPQEVQAVLNGDTITTRTDPVAVKVSMRTSGEETDILDVEDPLADTRFPSWALPLAIAMGAILLIFIGWLLHKKFGKKDREKILPPYEEAIDSLKKLRNKNFLAVGEQGAYFTELGIIVRRYIERRFGTDILDATVTELKQRMSHVAGLPEAYKESVVNLAVETEPVKFAKMKLAKERITFWEEWADRFFEDTKPQEDEKK